MIIFNNILFITHHYLSGNNGGAYASCAYINAFSKISQNMTLLYPYKDGECINKINTKIKKTPISYTKTKIEKFIDLLNGNVHRYVYINKYIDTTHFDCVVFDTSMVSFKLIDHFKQQGSKTICIHHNYQYEYFRDNLNGIIRFVNLFWCKRYEKEAIQKCDINLTITNQDTELLKYNYGKGNEIIKHIGVFEYKTNDLPLIKEKANNYPTFIITGSLGAYQTEKSIIPWIKSYYKYIEKIFPEHKLIIAGRAPSNALYKECRNYPKIQIIPNPKSMDEILEQGDFYICPTSMGGGLKLRIMDGLKYGMPVISHIVSIRGYDEFVEENCLLSYSDTNEFINNLKLLRSKTFNKKRIQELFYQIFSYESGIMRLNKILQQ